MIAASVAAPCAGRPAAPYDVVFLDPPYPLADEAVADDLARARATRRWLVPGALVVVERSSRSPEPGWPAGFTGIREKRYGETVLWYGHAASTPAPEE